jgi:hypothetical protein
MSLPEDETSDLVKKFPNATDEGHNLAYRFNGAKVEMGGRFYH